jgi:uncharacterized membrane protein YqjE
MPTLNQLSRLCNIHRELPIAIATALMCLAHVLVLIAVDDAFVQAVMAFGAVVMCFITSCLIYGVIRFEQKWGAK